MEIVMFSDIIEENGRSIRENNLELTHTIPVGTLVEVTAHVDMANGTKLRGVCHMYVWAHTRDCDGTPLYSLSAQSMSGVVEMINWANARGDHQPTQAEMDNFARQLKLDKSYAARMEGFFRLNLQHGYSREGLRVLSESEIQK